MCAERLRSGTAVPERRTSMRLIDADKLNLLLGISDRDIYAKYMLDKMPTVDAVPVVRCRECKHLGFCGDATNLEVMGFYGYCSRGERKEGAE